VKTKTQKPKKPASISLELLRALPKAELHCHLDGSVRPQTLIELGKQYHVAMPRTNSAGLRDFMTVKDARNLEEYLERFSITLSVMQTAESLERIAYELVEDAMRDGVLYLETRFSPVLNVLQGLKGEDVVASVCRGLAKGEEKFGVTARVIVCALRHLPANTSLELAKLAVAFKGKGVVGFDLAGGEMGHPASVHAKAFDFARAHDMACTCHAGEGDGGSSVRQAVHTCGAHRIGHGTRLFEDRSLMDYVNDRRIPVEICITSNVQTHATESFESHPVRQYFDAGLNVVLNTDNRLMSNTTLTDEYAIAAKKLAFTFDELALIAINGFESAFVHHRERETLIAKARKAIAGLKRARS
jgi:adenosine deaminase